MSKVIFTVTEDEKKEIEELYDKKVALENVIKIVDVNNTKLYNQVMSDYQKTVKTFNEWWGMMSQKYQWEEGNWSINFRTNEIILL